MEPKKIYERLQKAIADHSNLVRNGERESVGWWSVREPQEGEPSDKKEVWMAWRCKAEDYPQSAVGDEQWTRWGGDEILKAAGITPDMRFDECFHRYQPNGTGGEIVIQQLYIHAHEAKSGVVEPVENQQND